MRIGIVCEGKLDAPILESFIEKILKDRGVENIEIEYLQPRQDATGSWDDGGYSRVVTWCQTNSGEALKAYLSAPLFDGDLVYDIIVVHIDGDALDACAYYCPGVPVPKNNSVAERVATMCKMIDSWLNPNPKEAIRIKKAIPSLHSEAWVLAGLSSNVHEWEAVNAKAQLRQEFRVKRSKLSQSYQDLAFRAAQKSDLIKQRCESFAIFEDELCPE